MIKNFLKFFAIFSPFFFGIGTIFAAHPFTDINNNSELSTAVSDLYEANVISNDGTNLFRPNDAMNRDFYVSLATAIGCKECLTPSTDDLVRYHISPFVDLPKTNEFYYCIAYAAEHNITHWYNIDPNIGTASCENGEKFSSDPFCADNKISRIEAAAMLLRRAKLWDDTKNSGNFQKTENFSDVSNYWFGYAQKAIEFGIISKKSDNSIGQDEKITRWEFALMAAKVLQYTQCAPSKKETRISSYIEIRNSADTITDTTIFSEWEKFTLIPKTEPGNWKYSWTATPIQGGNSTIITSHEPKFPGNTLPPGKWIISVKIIDPSTNTPISEPSVTITITPKNPDNDDFDEDDVKNIDDKCPYTPGSVSNFGCPDNTGFIDILDKDRNPTNQNNFDDNDDFYFDAKIPNVPDNSTYTWTFTNKNGDSVTGNWKEFPGKNLDNGDWTATVVVTTPNGGKITPPSTSITISPNHNNDGDDDNDGIPNKTDRCPKIPWPTYNFGCPIRKTSLGVSITPNPSVTYIGNPITFTPTIRGGNDKTSYKYSWDYGDGTRTGNAWVTTHPYTSWGTYSVTLTITDRETGETAQSTAIVRITNDKDSDGDGVFDDDDLCPLIKWPKENKWCPTINTPDYGCAIRGVYSGNINCKNTSIDSDNDGIPDDTDKCPLIPGPKENFGCPLNPDGDDDNDGTLNKDDRCPTIVGPKENFGCPNDRDGDGVIDANDKCPDVRGLPEWQGCPHPETYNNISNNICLLSKLNTSGLITGAPACNSCPCANSVTIESQLRDCDILFPSILSPEKKTIYSRGNFYLVQ